jgi:hypothetical protein
MRYALFSIAIALALAGCATLSPIDTTSTATTPAAHPLTTHVLHPGEQDPALGCGAGAWGSCPPWLDWPR